MGTGGGQKSVCFCCRATVVTVVAAVPSGAKVRAAEAVPEIPTSAPAIRVFLNVFILFILFQFHEI